MKYLLHVCLILIIVCVCSCSSGEDFYELLKISRDATVKEIRKAFKSLAIKLHPDKNKEDPDAEKKFIKITKAYEVLRDPSKRKHYDVHGDTEFDNFKQTYHSYKFYTEQFGIYDDDPLIVTLSKNDYEINVLDDSQPWFVNFYSPYCHHCHELAPTWRQLAQELEGIVRFAAVNCDDDYPLCYSLGIESYPTLLYYEKEAHMYEGQRYYDRRNVDSLRKYVLEKIKIEVKEIDKTEWDLVNNRSWVLMMCDNDYSECPEENTRKKIAATLEGLISTGVVRESFSKEFSVGSGIILWKVEKDVHNVYAIDGSDYKEIVDKVLQYLPDPKTLDEKDFSEIRKELRSDVNAEAWLICFYLGAARDLNLQLKRLPTLMSNINIGLIHCARSAELCNALHISRYPSWGLLKSGGAFEIYQGRDEILYEIAAFARDGSKSKNLHALSPADFLNIKREGSAWIIDWYAPWCPPCKKFLPEFRKSSLKFEPEKIQFGTIDCTLHRDLCFKNHITSYPTIQLINGSHIHKFHGMLQEASISEFVEDHINPIVMELDEQTFVSLERKIEEEIWVVDYYASWCGPCQKLMPEWRRLAKAVSQFHEVKIASVDCAIHSNICDSQNIGSYPTIRLYPLGSRGLSSMAIYNGNRDHVSMKRWILNFIPSNIEELSEKEFINQILKKKYILPWLVDFYAPWCGHCVHFEPEFRSVAKRLEGRVRTAKIDCQENRIFCGYQRVSGFPTVRLYFSPDKFHNIESQDANEITRIVKQLVKEHKEEGLHDEL